MSSLLAILFLAASSLKAGQERTPDTAIAKARALYEAREQYRAGEIIAGALRRDPDDLKLHIAHQQLQENLGNFESVLWEYWERYESTPTAQNAYLLARLDDNRPRAMEIVDKAVRAGGLHPGLDWLKTERRAAALAYNGKYEKALDLIDSSADGRKVDPCGVKKVRAGLLISMGRLAEAWKETAEAGRLEPYEPALTTLRAGIAALLGDKNLLSIELTTGPYMALGRFAYADAARGYQDNLTGNHEGAMEHYREALKHPRDALGWHSARAAAYDSLGQPDHALVEAQAALNLDPFDDSARLRVASALPQDKAEAAIAEVYDRNPRGYEVLMWMGYQHFSRGRFREAEALFGRALEYAPGISDIWAARGAVRTHLGDKKGAWNDLRRAQDLAPFNAIVNRELGRDAMNHGRFEDCLLYFRRFVETGQDAVEALTGYGRCSIGTANYEQAVAAYEKAFKLSDSFAAGRDAAGNKAWAAAQLREISERYPNDEGVATIALKKVDAVTAEKGVPETVEYPRWTKDGRAVFYTVPGGIKRLDLMTAATTYVWRGLPSDAREKGLSGLDASGEMVVSDDGRTLYALLFEFERGRPRSMRLSVIDAATGAERPLHRQRMMRKLERDARGRLFVFGGGNLRLDPATNGQPEPWETVGCLMDIAVSPDGERIVCVTANASGPENGELVLYDLAAKKRTYLKAAGRRPSWSPDGKTIAYVWRERELRTIDPLTQKVLSYLNPFDVERITPDKPSRDEATIWSPDGRFVHFTIGRPPKKDRFDWAGRRSIIADLGKRKTWVHEDTIPNFQWTSAAKP